MLFIVVFLVIDLTSRFDSKEILEVQILRFYATFERKVLWLNCFVFFEAKKQLRAFLSATKVQCIEDRLRLSEDTLADLLVLTNCVHHKLCSLESWPQLVSAWPAVKASEVTILPQVQIYFQLHKFCGIILISCRCIYYLYHSCHSWCPRQSPCQSSYGGKASLSWLPGRSR